MDALRRAEQTRRGVTDGAPPAAAEHASVPPEPPPDAGALPGPEPRLELIEEPAEPVRRRAREAAPQDEPYALSREAARRLFEAKPAAPRHGLQLALALAGLAAAGSLAGYVWLETRPSSGIGLPQALRPQPIPARLASPAAASAPAAPAVAAAPAAPAPETPRPSPAAGAQPVAVAAPARMAHPESPPAVAPSPPARAAERPAPAARIAIRLTRSEPRVHPDLARAHLLHDAGDLDGAGAAYERVLDGEPKNTDALRGLAALALRRDDAQAAQDYYLRALEADPRDAAAAAALIGLRGEADPVRSESRLKTLIAAAPHEPAAHLALGNLYAAQNRWHEAQQSYFNAHAAEPSNPDYRYNLAVSLDHLRQIPAAIRYYRGALEAAAAAPAGFDRSRVEARLRELEP